MEHTNQYTIEEYVKELKKVLDDFEHTWKDNLEKEGEDLFPKTLERGDWDEQLFAFMGYDPLD